MDENQQSMSNKNDDDSNYHKVDDETDGPGHSWYILSLLSWTICIITIWNNGFFWTKFDDLIIKESGIYNYFPIKFDIPWLYIFILLISLIGFLMYLIFTTCKKKQNFYDGMMGVWAKFHFIPLLFISALNITLEYTTTPSLHDKDEIKFNKMLLVFDIVFTLLALITLLIVYIKTELSCEWYLVLAIKKGFFSTFIIYLWYNLFYVIICLRAVDVILDGDDVKDRLTTFFRGTGIAFAVVFGIGSFIFSFIFNDVVAAFVNFLIYLGLVIDFFESYRKEKIRENFKDEFNGVADGVIDIVMMCLSLALIVILIIRHNQVLV